jgi:hypothetical protein
MQTHELPRIRIGLLFIDKTDFDDISSYESPETLNTPGHQSNHPLTLQNDSYALRRRSW